MECSIRTSNTRSSSGMFDFDLSRFNFPIFLRLQIWVKNLELLPKKKIIKKAYFLFSMLRLLIEDLFRRELIDH